MGTKQEIFRNIILQNLPKNAWVNILDVYKIVENNIGTFEPDDFAPLADYNHQERWKRNVRNALGNLKNKGPLEWDGNANYLLRTSGTKKKINPTGKKSNADLLEGDKLYIKRARKALPILVRQARAEMPIYYSDLAEELGMPNPRNLNYVLGAIGNALEKLVIREKMEKIPVLNCIVINKSAELPGEGITWFIEQKDFESLTQNQRRKVIDNILTEIYLYKDWHWVLSELGLTPITSDYDKKLKKKKKYYGGGGESEAHKDFKNFIAENPNLFDLSSKLIGTTEYELPSMDAIDVVFTNKDEIIGIEVKSFISNSADIQRGLFQCIKYKALLEAEQKVNDLLPNSRVILAVEGKFPISLIPIKNQLGIEVYEHKSDKKRATTKCHM